MNYHIKETEAQEEKRLRELLGDAEFDRLANEDDSEIPTVVIGRDQSHKNIFLAFQSKAELEGLIHQLTSVLASSDDDLTVSVQGQIETFGEYCKEQDQ